MRSSSRFFVSVFIGLFFAIIGTAIFFPTIKVFAFDPQFQIVVIAALVPSLAVIFTIIAYLLLPKND